MVERPDQTGMAHLLEHMLFQGTSNRDALEIARLMDGAGGRIGAFTSRDYACYFAQVLEEFTPFAIDLLGDVLLNSVFPEDALEREKHAILCEYEAHQDQPEQRVHALLRRSLWPDHPLGSPILGSPGGLAAMDREDLIYFLHTHYQPDRMVVAAAGNLVHEDFVAQVRDAFWRLLGHRAPTPTRRPVPRSGVVIEPAAVSQAYFSFGVPAPAFASDDRLEAHLLDQVLGAGISSRLFENLRERHGLVYQVASSYDAWRDAGLLSVEGSAAAATLPQTIRLVLDELQQLFGGTRPIREDELHRAKIRLRSQIQLAAEDTHALMSRLATQEIYFGRHFSEEELLQQIEAIDADRMAAWIAETMAPGLGSMAVSLLGPVQEQEEAVRAALAEIHWSDHDDQPQTPGPSIQITA